MIYQFVGGCISLELEQRKRTEILLGQSKIPENFDRMGEKQAGETWLGVVWRHGRNWAAIEVVDLSAFLKNKT